MHTSLTVEPFSSVEPAHARRIGPSACAGPEGNHPTASGLSFASRAGSSSRACSVEDHAPAISTRARPSGRIAATARVTCRPSGATSTQAPSRARCSASEPAGSEQSRQAGVSMAPSMLVTRRHNTSVRNTAGGSVPRALRIADSLTV